MKIVLFSLGCLLHLIFLTEALLGWCQYGLNEIGSLEPHGLRFIWCFWVMLQCFHCDKSLPVFNKPHCFKRNQKGRDIGCKNTNHTFFE